MKRYISALFLFIMCFISGSSQSKLFKEAIKRGLNSNGYYSIKNTNNDGVTEKKMREFLQKKGYIVGDFTTQEARVYGTIFTVVKTMDFFSENDLELVSFNKLKINNINSALLKDRGTAFIPSRNKVKVAFRDPVPKYKYAITYEQIDNVLWSGEIKDGFISGKGGGIAKKGNEYIYIEGVFSYGIPQSNGWINRCEANVGGINYQKSQKSQLIEVGSDNMPENKDIPNKLSQAIRLQSPIWYKEDAKKLDTASQNVKKLTQNVDKLNRADFESNYKNDFSETFINTYTYLGYDPDNLIFKAKDIQDIYTVLDALTLKTDIQYYAYSNYITSRNIIEPMQGKIQKAINIAKKGKLNNNSEFQNFYTYIGDPLDAKLQEFRENLNRDYNREVAEYSELRERRTAERHELEESVSSFMAKIDRKRSKRPSGKISDHGGLFSHVWCHDSDGIIYYNYENGGGVCAKYNISYKDKNGSEIEYYFVDLASFKSSNKLRKETFKTEKELFEEVARAVEAR